MNNFVVDTHVQFDAERIVRDVTRISQQYKFDQINLTKIAGRDDVDSISYLSGSTIDMENDYKIIEYSHAWNQINPLFEDTYLADVIKTVRQYVREKYNKGIGRVRIMHMRPKTTLSFHKDLESLRLHIPVVTAPGAMFIHNTTVSTMPTPGRLYTFDSATMHTAVNATKIVRTHIVFSAHVLTNV